MAFRRKILMVALGAALAVSAAGDAFARAGSGLSMGSRGARTYSVPPATSTAPRGAVPLERSWTSPNDSMFRRPPAYSQGGFFPGSFTNGFLGGLLGAGLLGLLFGHGLFGGLGGGLSILGLVLQIALLYLLFRLVMGFFRGQSAFQGVGLGSRTGRGFGFNPRGAFVGFGSSGSSSGRGTKLELTPADFSMFEYRLGAIQAAYSEEDLDRLRALATPEMVGYFADQLAANANRGLVNKIADVKFLQGDLSEAWRERQAEYATVAMRFSLIDTMVDRNTGKIVSGDPAAPQEVTEVWTFTRQPGGAPGDWKLSAIEQA